MRRENLRSVDMQEQRHQHQYPKQYEAQTPNQTQTRFFANDRNDREPAIEMHSNWRQYLLEGNIRQPRHTASTSQNSNSSSLQTTHTYSSPPTYRTQQHVRPSRSNATRSIRY
ncbi:unnamed protein product [Anisakis simplex]|uniref:Uncharacterized protein n=1 Tax=Anisakis simplex TaxID=6269 RepID=A0A0M3KJH5_ANISI|nr:unnamed protein product [Anisakis simplex]